MIALFFRHLADIITLSSKQANRLTNTREQTYETRVSHFCPNSNLSDQLLSTSTRKYNMTTTFSMKFPHLKNGMLRHSLATLEGE